MRQVDGIVPTMTVYEPTSQAVSNIPFLVRAEVPFYFCSRHCGIELRKALAPGIHLERVEVAKDALDVQLRAIRSARETPRLAASPGAGLIRLKL